VFISTEAMLSAWEGKENLLRLIIIHRIGAKKNRFFSVPSVISVVKKHKDQPAGD
jgi:hypothetical protein